MMGGDWGMGWGMGFGWIIWLFIIGLIIWGIKAISDKRSQSQSSPGGDRSLEILKERYARGEIDREEFEERKRDLLA